MEIFDTSFPVLIIFILEMLLLFFLTKAVPWGQQVYIALFLRSLSCYVCMHFQQLLGISDKKKYVNASYAYVVQKKKITQKKLVGENYLLHNSFKILHFSLQKNSYIIIKKSMHKTPNFLTFNIGICHDLSKKSHNEDQKT